MELFIGVELHHVYARPSCRGQEQLSLLFPIYLYSQDWLASFLPAAAVSLGSGLPRSRRSVARSKESGVSLRRGRTGLLR